MQVFHGNLVLQKHRTLIKNGLRNKVVIEADGKLMTGRDVVIAAILGAQKGSSAQQLR